MSIEQNSAEVEKQKSTKKFSLHNYKLAQRTERGCVFAPGGSNLKREQENARVSVKELKEAASFRAILENDGHRLKQSGRYTKCCCPFHQDQTPSFCVYENDAYAKCFGCGWYGDVIKYKMEFDKVRFQTAMDDLAAFVSYHPRARRTTEARIYKPKSIQHDLSQKVRDERDAYARRLEEDAWIAKRICDKRFERTGERWNPKTLQGIAIQGPLGWAGDALAFMYPSGTKFRRWPEKEFYWEADCLSLWRGHMLPTATHVYLTESETDAISLIDGDVEKDGNVAVIAAPSATSFEEDWAPQFDGKIVSLCYDNDKSGEAGMLRVASMLEGYAKELRTINWKELI